MEFFPEDYESNWTLRSSVSRSGIGLHTGKESEVTLAPFDSEGFFVSWIDSDRPPLRLKPSQVVNSQLCTTLDFGIKKLSTVEHLLAAMFGCGLTQVHIIVSGTEIPLLDGSAIEWVEAIREAGMMKISTPRQNVLAPTKALTLYKESSVITAIPSDVLKLVGIIDFPYPAIGRQTFSLELTPRSFVKEIAPARTFGFKDQIDALIAQGLIQGGDLNNSLVCDGQSWLNPPLRFQDEPVRHKLLDLIGDLALVGLPKAQILVYRGSHALHAEFAESLPSVCSLSQFCFD